MLANEIWRSVRKFVCKRKKIEECPNSDGNEQQDEIAAAFGIHSGISVGVPGLKIGICGETGFSCGECGEGKQPERAQSQ